MSVVKANEFYESLEKYHEKIHPVEQLINDYFSKREMKVEKEYAAVRLENFRVVRSTENINKPIEMKIQSWYNNFEKKEISKSIFKIEFDDKIFLFKMFDFGNGECILAGYLLSDTSRVRSFLASLTEKTLIEKYERILSIL